MMRSALRVLVMVAAMGVAPGAFAAGAASPPPIPGVQGTQRPVTLTINPDGTAVWNGEPLAGPPALENKLSHRTLQDPKLELDVQFHSVGQLNDSNRQTLLDILALAARFGYVHVEATGDGARLTVLGPTAGGSAPK